MAFTLPPARRDDTTTVKTALRESARTARRGLEPGERRVASQAAAARVLTLPELRRARTVLLYAALAEEADPSTLVATLAERGKRLLFPRVTGDGLRLVAVQDLATLTLGYRGISEPSGPEVDPAEVDLAVIPGVAYDLLGGRLGQGGGHYDRLLPQLPVGALRVGLCFSCQVVPFVPCDVHDEPVDVVVTERATYRTDARELRDA